MRALGTKVMAGGTAGTVVVSETIVGEGSGSDSSINLGSAVETMVICNSPSQAITASMNADRTTKVTTV